MAVCLLLKIGLINARLEDSVNFSFVCLTLCVSCYLSHNKRTHTQSHTVRNKEIGPAQSLLLFSCSVVSLFSVGIPSNLR